MYVMCSRGCPYECTYCSMAKTVYRIRDPEGVVDEMISLSNTHPCVSLGFGDDVFTLNNRFVEGVCDGIRKTNQKIRWSCTTRADLIERDLLEDMHKAGCWHISIGVETGVEDVRYSLNKKIDNHQYHKVFHECREIGIKTRAYAMFGHIGESIEDMHKTISFVRELKPDEVVFSLVSIYPGTELAKQALDEGVINKDVWGRRMIRGLGAPIYKPRCVCLKDFKEVICKAGRDFKIPETPLLSLLCAFETEFSG